MRTMFLYTIALASLLTFPSQAFADFATITLTKVYATDSAGTEKTCVAPRSTMKIATTFKENSGGSQELKLSWKAWDGTKHPIPVEEKRIIVGGNSSSAIFSNPITLPSIGGTYELQGAVSWGPNYIYRAMKNISLEVKDDCAGAPNLGPDDAAYPVKGLPQILSPKMNAKISLPATATWTDSGDPLFYYVYIEEGPNGQAPGVEGTKQVVGFTKQRYAGTSLDIPAGSLTSGPIYRLTVWSYKTGGFSKYAATSNFTVKNAVVNAPLPPIPTTDIIGIDAIAPGNESEFVSKNDQLQWKAFDASSTSPGTSSSKPISFTLMVSPNRDEFTAALVDPHHRWTVDGTTNTIVAKKFSDLNFSDAVQRYYWRVTARNSHGKEIASPIAWFSTGPSDTVDSITTFSRCGLRIGDEMFRGLLAAGGFTIEHAVYLNPLVGSHLLLYDPQGYLTKVSAMSLSDLKIAQLFTSHPIEMGGVLINALVLDDLKETVGLKLNSCAWYRSSINTAGTVMLAVEAGGKIASKIPALQSALTQRGLVVGEAILINEQHALVPVTAAKNTLPNLQRIVAADTTADEAVVLSKMPQFLAEMKASELLPLLESEPILAVFIEKSLTTAPEVARAITMLLKNSIHRESLIAIAGKMRKGTMLQNEFDALLSAVGTLYHASNDADGIGRYLVVIKGSDNIAATLASAIRAAQRTKYTKLLRVEPDLEYTNIHGEVFSGNLDFLWEGKNGIEMMEQKTSIRVWCSSGACEISEPEIAKQFATYKEFVGRVVKVNGKEDMTISKFLIDNDRITGIPQNEDFLALVKEFFAEKYKAELLLGQEGLGASGAGPLAGASAIVTGSNLPSIKLSSINLLAETPTEADDGGKMTWTKTTNGGIEVTESPSAPNGTAREFLYDLDRSRLNQFRWIRDIPENAAIEAKLSWDSPDAGYGGIMLAGIGLIDKAGYLHEFLGLNDGDGGRGGYGAAGAVTRDYVVSSGFNGERWAFGTQQKISAGSATLKLERAGNHMKLFVDGTLLAEHNIQGEVAGVSFVTSGHLHFPFGTARLETFTLQDGTASVGAPDVTPTKSTVSATAAGSNLLTETPTEADDGGKMTWSKQADGSIQVEESPSAANGTYHEWLYDLDRSRVNQLRWVRTIPENATIEAKMSWDTPDGNYGGLLLAGIGFIDNGGYMHEFIGMNDGDGTRGSYGSLGVTMRDYRNNGGFNGDGWTFQPAMTTSSGNAMLKLVRSGKHVQLFINDKLLKEQDIQGEVAGVAFATSGHLHFPFGMARLENFTLR